MRQYDADQAEKSVVTGGTKILTNEATDAELDEDLKIVDQVIRSKDWAIPEIAFDHIPRRMTLIALNKVQDGQGLVDANYDQDLTVRAANLLTRMNRENRHKLIGAARLRQIHDGKQAEQHTHLHQDNVLIVLPHNSRDQLAISKAGGNSDGR